MLTCLSDQLLNGAKPDQGTDSFCPKQVKKGIKL
jgi:hypothetical protein